MNSLQPEGDKSSQGRQDDEDKKVDPKTTLPKQLVKTNRGQQGKNPY